jgi:HEAT repeat protein
MRSLALILPGLLIVGCVSDPQDPKTWIKKLDDPRESKDAVSQLKRLNDPVAVPALIELYKKTKDVEHLKAIAHFKDKRQVPIMVDALDYSEESCDAAATAANALSQTPDENAVDPLIKALLKPLNIKTRCNIVKVESMKALTTIHNPKGVEALTKVLQTSADEQDFFLNQEAARALGAFADAHAIPALVRGLFMTGRGVDIYQPCRVALLQIGKAAVPALIEAHQRKNEKLEEDAKKGEFREGIIEQKTALVLGDLRAKEAVPVLLAELKKPKKGDNRRGALYALGMIADPTTIKELVAVLSDSKEDYADRISAAEALNLAGDPSALPALLAVAKTGDVTKDGEKFPDVRMAAAMAYSRIGGPAEAAAFAPLAATEKAAKDVFDECAQRLEVAKKCNKDLGCYAGALADPVLAKQEKAAFMLARMGKEALPALIKAVSTREIAVRQAVIFALGKVADKSSTDAKKALDMQIELDRTKPPLRPVVEEMRAVRAQIESRS